MSNYHSIFRADLFAGQTILVTGGGSGIGRATAHELAALGAHVVISGRTAAKLHRVAVEISAAGGSVRAIPANIREEADVQTLISTVITERGSLHGLVNNAGGQFVSPAEFINRKGWHAVVDTNLTGTFLMCREAFTQWMNDHGGTIVNMLIQKGGGFPGMAHSAAARAGVESLTETLAVEWARAGVRVNAVAPGLINSSGLENYPEAMRPLIEKSVENIPYKRMGSEGEVAAAIVFLLSPGASFISGATIKIDGAGSLWRKPWEVPTHSRAPRPYDGFNNETT